MELSKVFVPLSLAPRPAHLISADPVRYSAGTLKAHDVWHYLDAEKGVDRNLAVIGAPGCGKTTLLKNVIISVARKELQLAFHKRALRSLLVGLIEEFTIPILLFLREHAEYLSAERDPTLVDVLRRSLARLGLSDVAPWIGSYLDRGRCIILLDGLDEIADVTARKSVANWVDLQIRRYHHCCFIITSRPFGYKSNPLTGVTTVEVLPFTTSQVQKFVTNWYLANELMSSQRDDQGVRLRAEEGATDLLARLRRTPALSALAINPLLLTMITTVHRYRSSLPRMD